MFLFPSSSKAASSDKIMAELARLTKRKRPQCKNKAGSLQAVGHLIIGSEESDRLQSADSGYCSFDSRPSSSLSKLGGACPTLPRFSWQSDEPADAKFSTSKQHANNEDNSWAQIQHSSVDQPGLRPWVTPTPQVTPQTPSYTTFQLSNNMTEGLQGQSFNDDASGPNKYGEGTSQPVLALKDSGTAAFPSFQRDQPSPTKSECSEEESTQPSFQQPSAAASSQPYVPGMRVAGVGNPPGVPPQNLSGLVSSIHRTTGREPPGLVGASTTIVGDTLFVFGGRRINPQRLTQSLYALDLISRHWTKLEPSGDIPSPRFFHTLCALGDSKLVCYGGMALATPAADSSQRSTQSDTSMTVTSEIHIYDIATRVWTLLSASESPSRRYAHCATILPSSAVFSSSSAALSALRHNPSSSAPNQGTLGVSIDGRGGAEMIVFGGQNGQSDFIDSMEVFNFRNLKWSPPVRLPRSYGAYRSVISPLLDMPASRIGSQQASGSPQAAAEQEDAGDDDGIDAGNEDVSGSPMLIFSNHNFLNPRIEVMVRMPDGKFVDKAPKGATKPPGLRFPNGGIVDKHMIVSGTYITSTHHEYMIWALDLHTLVWHRIDASGSGGLNDGSWNRGIVWHKRNTYVVLGNRRRGLYKDYTTRRLNFSDICTVELEAFGLYNNPRRTLAFGLPRFGGAPLQGGSTTTAQLERYSRDMKDVRPVESLGNAALTARELCDMELLSRDGERIAVNSQILRMRWGPYFQQLLREDPARANDRTTGLHHPPRPTTSIDTTRNRSSIVTVTPSTSTSMSNGTTAVDSDNASQRRPSVTSSFTTITRHRSDSASHTTTSTLRYAAAAEAEAAEYRRSRVLYLPHTYLTIRALVHYLYTTALPPPTSPFCTPQILCSLLQLARPYRVDGLLEATVERLHQVLDGRNTAAVFNAAAMAAGGGDAIRYIGDAIPLGSLSLQDSRAADSRAESAASAVTTSADGFVDRAGATSQQTMIEDDSDVASSSASNSTTPSLSDIEEVERDMGLDIWKGDFSAVVGLQKRGLRGLMEFRRMRVPEGQTRGDDPGTGGVAASFGDAGHSSAANPAMTANKSAAGGSSVGLGIG